MLQSASSEPPFRSQAPVAIAEKRKTHPVTGATAAHLARGPRLRPRLRPLPPLRVPPGTLRTRPGLPWGGVCLPAPYGGAEGVRPPPGPAPLPPGPTNPLPPAPPSMGSESSGDRSPSAAMAAPTAFSFGQGSGSRRRSHSHRRYRVPRAPARLAPSSPRNQWPAPPRSAPQHVISYPRPRRAIIRGEKPIPGPVKAALLSHWGMSQYRQLSHNLPEGRWACKNCT